LHAVIHDQIGCFAILQQQLDQLPQAPCGQSFPLQVIRDGIMTDPIQMLCQIAARVVDRCADQIFDGLAFGYHAFHDMLFSLPSESPNIVMKALAFDPAERYQSAAEMKAALEAL
jgi:hypothetical protein